MVKQSFHFEISDLIIQFLAAFDQVVINRYDVAITPKYVPAFQRNDLVF